MTVSPEKRRACRCGLLPAYTAGFIAAWAARDLVAGRTALGAIEAIIVVALILVASISSDFDAKPLMAGKE